MALHTALLPERAMAFPLAAVLSALLWFLDRDVGIRLGRADLAVDWFRVALLAAIAVVGSYLVAALVVAVLDGTGWRAPAWASPIVSPSDATLLAFAAIAAPLAAYVVGGALATIPDWIDTVAAPIGLLLGWPLLVSVLAYYAVGNAIGGGLPFLVEAGFVAVGVAASVAWLFVLSSWIAALVGAAGAHASGRTG